MEPSNIGSTEEGRSAASIVPSAVITAEQNVLLNPRHPDVRRVRILADDPFSFDTRLS